MPVRPESRFPPPFLADGACRLVSAGKVESVGLKRAVSQTGFEV